jgi:hypothetical protein
MTMNDTKQNPFTLTREDLYELTWSKPMSDLAKDFGISDVALGKRCRNLGIPVPGRGYWARVDAGQKPYRPQLPQREPQIMDYGALTVAPPAGLRPSSAQGLEESADALNKADAAWLAERAAFEDRRDSVIEVTETPKVWDPAIRACRDRLELAAKDMRAWKKDSDSYDARPKSRKRVEDSNQAWKWRRARDNGERLSDSHESVAFRVSLGTHQRALHLTNALALASRDRGFTVRDDEKLGRLVFAGHNADIQFRITEQLQVKTRPRVGYDGKTEQESYKVPTGRLRIVLQIGYGDGPTFEDRGTTKLESLLNRVFVAMYRLTVKHWVQQRESDARERRYAEAERQRAEADRIRKEQERQAAAERQRRTALIAEAQHWSTAQSLRDYVTHIRSATASVPSPASPAATNSSMSTSSISAWSDWAQTVANDLDPTTTRLSATGSAAASDPADA